MWSKQDAAKLLQSNMSLSCLAVGIRGGPDLHLAAMGNRNEARGHRGGGGKGGD